MTFFTEKEETALKVIWRHKNIRIAKESLSKKEQG
jgi:hypothetical protein